MHAVVRVLLVVPLAGALLAGCAGPSRLRSCPELDPPPAGLGRLVLDKEDDSYQDSLFCDWHVGETLKIAARFHQPVSYTEGQPRAGAVIEHSWRKDDDFNVTRRVDGLGDGGYRYTSIIDDEVKVTVKGFLVFRELGVEVSQRYTSDEDVAALEETAEKLARVLLEVS